MTILITGGTGSIGGWVTHRLYEKGRSPVVFDNRIEEKYLADIADDIVLLEGDVCDLSQLRDALEDHSIDRIIHLAKVVGKRGEANPRLPLKVNVLGSGYVLQAAQEHGIKRVVFTSSKSMFSEITGDHAPPTFEPITEAYPKFRRTAPDVPFYSTTNKMVEYFGIRYAMAHDMEFVITRFGANYGPGKIENLRKWHENEEGALLATPSFWACEMTNCALRGTSLHIAEDRQDNFVYTKDLAQGVVRAALCDEIPFEKNHREFLLDGGYVASLSDFATRLNHRFPAVESTVGETGVRPTACAFDTTRARAELGYEPEFDLDNAIDDYIRTEQQYRTD